MSGFAAKEQLDPIVEHEVNRILMLAMQLVASYDDVATFKAIWEPLPNADKTAVALALADQCFNVMGFVVSMETPVP